MNSRVPGKRRGHGVSEPRWRQAARRATRSQRLASAQRRPMRATASERRAPGLWTTRVANCSWRVATRCAQADSYVLFHPPRSSSVGASAQRRPGRAMASVARASAKLAAQCICRESERVIGCAMHLSKRNSNDARESDRDTGCAAHLSKRSSNDTREISTRDSRDISHATIREG